MSIKNMDRRGFIRNIGTLMLGAPLLKCAGPDIISDGTCKDYDYVINPNNAQYLIIASDELYNGAKKLSDFRGKNYNVDMIKVSDICINPTNSVIRDFIFEYSIANPNLEYLLLIGDTDKIPTFLVDDGEGQFPTDFPYSNIKTEGKIPDLAVGRIPCQSSDDLELITQKIISFDERKVERPLLIGNGAEIEYYGPIHKEFLSSIGYFPTLIKNTDNSNNDLKNTVEEINQGVDALVHYGHGDFFNMYPFTRMPLPALKGNPFILFSSGCNVMNFSGENSLKEIKNAFGLDPCDPCIGYSFLKHENGSVASIGASKFGGYGYDYSFIKGFFSGIGMNAIGKLLKNACIYALDEGAENGADTKFSESFIKRLCLMGDPALKLSLR